MPELTREAIDPAQRSSITLADEEVVSRVLCGEVAAFEVLMRRYNQRLFRVVRGIVNSEHEAEDVVQETYVRAFEHLRQFAGRARFSTWLTKIAIHESFARLRLRSRMRPVDFDADESAHKLPTGDASDVAQDLSNQELGALLTRVVDGLPVELRIVFAMRLIEGLDTSETASCLELTEANVKVRLHRARALLRQRIDAEIGLETRQLYQFGGARCDRIVQAVLARLGQS